MDSEPHNTKCNPAAVARNKHPCESLADSCFPVTNGPISGRLHGIFSPLQNSFCDAHTCNGGPKPFSKLQKVEFAVLLEL
ncbi:hypothetical protein CRYUN_Cryun22dG0011200 [Craigia yunnanensis]